MQRTQQHPPLKSNKKKLVGALPSIFAEIIFGFVYYIFVVRWIPVLFTLSETAGLMEGILFHVIFFLCQASFLKTILTDPGMIPDRYLEVCPLLLPSLLKYSSCLSSSLPSILLSQPAFLRFASSRPFSLAHHLFNYFYFDENE